MIAASGKGYLLMTFKGILKSVAKAFLYFAVYFGWQIVVVYWAYIAATFMTVPGLDVSDPSMIDFNALTSEILTKSTDFIMKYSLHLTLVAGILAVATDFIITKARRRSFFTELSIKKFSLSSLPILILLGASLNIFVSLVLNMIPFPQEWIDSYTESSQAIVGGGTLISWFVTVISAPIVEEITFRGFMYSRLKQGMPMFAAMIVSSWVFGLVHGEIIWVIYASLLGMLLTWVAEKHGSLAASMVVHISFNLFGMLSSYVNELSTAVFWLSLISSGLAAAAAVMYINRSSERRIEFSFKKDTSDVSK